MYIGRIEKLLTHYTIVPTCIVNSTGKVVRANDKIADVFKYDSIEDADIFALTGIKLDRMIEAAKEGESLALQRNDKAFKLMPELISEGETFSLMLYFIDVTDYEELKARYDNERPCIALVNVDNLDELLAEAGEDREMELSTEIDKLIRGWGDTMGAAAARYKEHLYEIFMTHEDYEDLVEDNFCILDEARDIETDGDFPASLSIGIGMGGRTIAESEDFAQEALDLALGRGGDQAVVKNAGNFEYYGGKSHSVEKRNKGKSRILAHALKSLMIQSSRIFIMGHKNPDMDGVGSAMGICRIAETLGKDAYIVMDSYGTSMDDLMQDVKDAGEYEIISGAKALTLCDEDSLAVVVDTSRPVLTECIELVEAVKRTVVIDHHRKTEDMLPYILLYYIEAYASSSSELVTELIQYACEKKTLTKLEADVLLAGIMVDTNRFAVKAGVRTFEAASWLKRAGADPEHVRKYFQSDADNFRLRALCIANARFLDTGIAMAVCPEVTTDVEVINAQVADELLTIKGMKASFAAGKNDKGVTMVSARSLGDINVQMIMENFGGGGHFSVAGVQTDMEPEEILGEIRKLLEQDNFVKSSQ